MITGARRVRCAQWSFGDPFLRDLGGTLTPHAGYSVVLYNTPSSQLQRAEPRWKDRDLAWNQEPRESSTHSVITKHGLGADQTQHKHTRH